MRSTDLETPALQFPSEDAGPFLDVQLRTSETYSPHPRAGTPMSTSKIDKAVEKVREKESVQITLRLPLHVVVHLRHAAERNSITLNALIAALVELTVTENPENLK